MDTQTSLNQVDLQEEVRRWISEFRARNDGAEPTRAQVTCGLKRRRSDVLRAINAIELLEADLRSQMSARPEIPEAVSAAASEAAQRTWVAACEVFEPRLEAAQRALSDRHLLHIQQREADHDMHAQTEDDLETERSRADQAEAALATASAEIAKLRQSLATEQAKTALLQDSILAAVSPAPADQTMAKNAPKARNSRSLKASEDDHDRSDGQPTLPLTT